MKKLIASAVALAALVGFAARGTDVDKALKEALDAAAFRTSGESFESVDFAFDDHIEYEGEPMVVPIGYLVRPAMPTNVPSSVSSVVFGSFEFGQKKRRSSFSIMYAIIAKGLADFDADDVVIDSITTSKGRDLSRRKNGQTAWEIERNGGAIFRDQGYTTFTLKCAGKVVDEPMPKVKGRVSFTVADRMVAKEFAGKVSAGSVGEGEFAWKVRKTKSMWGEDEGQLEVSPQSDKAQKVKIEVFSGGKKLLGTGNRSANGKIDYFFKLPSSDDIVIKAKCPEGARKITLELGGEGQVESGEDPSRPLVRLARQRSGK